MTRAPGQTVEPGVTEALGGKSCKPSASSFQLESTSGKIPSRRDHDRRDGWADRGFMIIDFRFDRGVHPSIGPLVQDCPNGLPRRLGTGSVNGPSTIHDPCPAMSLPWFRADQSLNHPGRFRTLRHRLVSPNPT